MPHPKIYPVIHHLDRETSVAEAAKAVSAGADGIFLISHHGDDVELISVASDIQRRHKGFPVGINLLSTGAVDAVQLASKFQFPMLWGDDMGVDSSGLNVTGESIQSLAKEAGQKLKIFASVAFKYRPHEPDPEQAARNALEAGFIPTTSGSGTGSAPELSKIKAMSEATNGVLAVASGMTPENVSQFAPYLSHILVATGIAINEHEMDVKKLSLLIANARQRHLATLQQHHDGRIRVIANDPNLILDCDAGWGFKQTQLFTQAQVQAAEEECHKTTSIHLWTVYDHPSDYTDGFIARRSVASPYRKEATQDVLKGPTLESVRQQLPAGLRNIGRSNRDDPKIVEIWV